MLEKLKSGGLMQEWINDITYLLMPARHPVPGHEEHYYKTYHCWRAAWEKYRQEVGITAPLNSDGFVQADEIGALFYKDKCVGLSAFTYGNLQKGPTAHLSWFNGWNEFSFKRLMKISSNAMIGSQFTVSPEFTGKNQIVRWKEIVFLFTFMRFEASIAEVMAGQLNLLRKVEDACGESFGATVLDPKTHFNYGGKDLPIQLVAYQKENIQFMKDNKNVHELCEQLWAKLIHISDYPVIKPAVAIKIAA
jgi:hypothetical protein